MANPNIKPSPRTSVFPCPNGVVTRTVENPDEEPELYAFVVEFPCVKRANNGVVAFDVFRFYHARNGDILVQNLTTGHIILDIAWDGTRYNISPLYGNLIPLESSASREGDVSRITFTYTATRKTYEFTGTGGPEAFSSMTGRASAIIVVDITNGDLVGQSLASLPLSSPMLEIFGHHHSDRYYRDGSGPGVEYPRISIEGLSAAQNWDFGEIFVTITDIFAYAGTFNGRPYKEIDLWISQFVKFPQINNVLKGKGPSLHQKFDEIIKHYNLTTPIAQFKAQMALYAYSKYVLAGFMYQNFSTKYLLRGFNQTFLGDLHDSRFSDFEIIFLDPQFGVVNFNRYFRSRKQCLETRPIPITGC